MPLLYLLAVGCGSSTRTYSVSIENRSAEPYMVWLTKNGPPMEQAWMSPEQIAVRGLERGASVPGTLLPAGKSVSRTNVSGKFDSRSDAILRVYRGERKFAELLAVQQGSSNRWDLVLAPGNNNVVIDQSGAVSLAPPAK
jgi:hypothetical protein